MSRKELWRLRKRRLIMRQTAIFGLLVALLVVVGAASAATFFGRMDPLVSAPFSSPTAESEDYGPMPCPRDESAMYPQAGLVRVNALNGSKAFGAATYLSLALESRGFGIGRVADAPFDYSGVALIRTGQQSVNRAYLLLAHAPEGTIMVMDGRTDETVDIIVGSEYETLRPAETVEVQAGTVIPFPPGCTPVAELAANLGLPPLAEQTPEDGESSADEDS
jgi:hypothetical protein